MSLEICAFGLYFKARAYSFDASATTFRTPRVSPFARHIDDTKGSYIDIYWSVKLLQ